MKSWVPLIMFLFLGSFARGQENYEIQVYASPTMTPQSTIFELHSNYTFQGEKQIVDGVRPSYHALHETIEITHGVVKNFEIGLYFFMNYTSPYGYQFVGTHIRPRVSAPESWDLPVGLSLSTEVGYQKKQYSGEIWNMEIRPIIDKQAGNFYFSLNPTFGITLKSSTGKNTAPAFAPNIKASYSISPVFSLGAEYYGDMGPVSDINPGPEQSHAIFAVVDLYVDPRWEINIGPGWGLTPATDAFVFKILLGRKVNWTKKKQEAGQAATQQPGIF